MIEWKRKDCITVQGAANKLGVKKAIVQEWIDEKKIEERDGLIQLETVEKVRCEIDRYISLEDFLKDRNTDKFNSRYAKNRDKFVYFLENNNFFGVTVSYTKDMLYPVKKNARFYFEKKDIDTIDRDTKVFFKFFGLTEKEKSEVLISECKNEKTKELLTEFVEREETYTSITTAFIKEVMELDLFKVTTNTIMETIDALQLVGSKDMFIKFVDFANARLKLKLGKIERKPNHIRKDIGAYPYQTYVVIAKNVFNENRIRKNFVLEKCFKKSIYFECWLFLSAHFVCGWRAQDICNNWPYVDSDKLKSLKINIETLQQDIIDNTIDAKIYYELGKYIEKSIELASVKAHKTGKASDLLAPIGRELKVFFGRLALIAAYHQSHNSGGYMKGNRISEYLNHVRIKELFGDEIYDLMGRSNLNSRRLNKSYLQSMEDRARKNGAGTMAAYTIASFARNHSNVDTMAIYIRDHGLSGETADVVLAMMMDRGVFGTIKYKELLAAFPNTFERLTAQEQTKLMVECGTSAYELEIMSADMMAELDLKKQFAEGDKRKALEILSEMFEISQGFGKAKEPGIYCKKRALGEACDAPTFKSCVANVCPYLVFTEAGIKSLISVIYDYGKKIETTGNPKYEVILQEVIFPVYREILKELSKRMDSEETKALKKAIGEYNGRYIKND